MAPCPAGRYCPTAGMGATPAPLCDAGYYCTEGTVQKSQQISCVMGKYCPQGSGTNDVLCPAGTMCPHPSYSIICSGTYVCPEGTVGKFLYDFPNSGLPTRCLTKVSVGVTSFYKFSSPNISPSHMAIDRLGNIFVSLYRTIYKITPEGIATTLVTLPGAGGPLGGMDFYPNGDLYFTAPDEHNIYKVDMAGSYTLVAGTGTPGYANNFDLLPRGTVLEFVRKRDVIPTFNFPMDIKWDHVGSGFFVSDYYNGAIRYVEPGLNGGITVRTIVNIDGQQSATFGQNINGYARTAQLRPTYMAVTLDGILYVLDQYNKRIVKKYVREPLTLLGFGTVSTYAGASYTGANSAPVDGNGTNAKFGDMTGIAVDLVGNVYISGGAMIRMIDPNQNVKTIAGVNNQYGNVNGVSSIVPANTDPIMYPSGTNRASPIPKLAPLGICVHPTGDVYFSEFAPHSSIRRLTFSCGSYKNGVLSYAFSFENSDKLQDATAPSGGAAPSGGDWNASFL